MKPEQASKVKSRMPTRLRFGEGRVGRGSNRHEHRLDPPGYVGTARWKGGSCNLGIPASGGGRVSSVALGGELMWESDRVMVPLRPGNAGGGKDPDFRRAFDDGEDR